MNNSVFFRSLLTLAVSLLASLAQVQAAEAARTFPNPEAAASALKEATTTQDKDALKALFGPGGQYLINPDPVMGKGELDHFSQAIAQGYVLTPTASGVQILEVGTDRWPFPVPLVQSGGQWQFDAAAGREEILDRRIGANELKVLESLRAFVAAQREYSSSDPNGDEIHEYARRFVSSPGKKDGLFWPVELDGTESPMGPLVAAAQAEGYDRIGTAKSEPEPFHGYYFKILTRQGKAAPAGAYNYVINGHLLGGFAAVAWPAEYGETGVMTFIVNQQGRVYQKDLGPKTSKIAKAMSEFNPGPGWAVSPD